MQLHPSSVAFDEDFEAELSENRDAKIEVSVLAKSPDPELTEVSSHHLFLEITLYNHESLLVQKNESNSLVDVILLFLNNRRTLTLLPLLLSRFLIFCSALWHHLLF